MIILGIDPDLSGALAVIDTARHEILMLHRMPIWEPPTGGHRGLDVREAWTLIQEAKSTHKAAAVALEAAIVKPQAGKNGGQAMMGSVGRTHQTYGALRALCELTFGRPGVVHAWPSSWKRDMGLSSDKAESRIMACNAYPNHHKVFSKVKNTGMAEAVLLGEWGGRTLTTGWKK